MGNQEELESTFTPSRRDFLKGATAASVAAVLTMGLSGCSSEEPTQQTHSTKESAGSYPVSVFESDVLIVGGGVCGLTAARTAIKGGSSVIIVDKGPWGACGTSGINWGHDIETNEWYTGDMATAMAFYATMNDGLMNQSYGIHVWEGLRTARPAAYAEQVGITLQRLEGGVSAAQNADSPMTIDHGYFLRWHARDIKLMGADVRDRTFILDVLKDSSGQAAGAVGIDIVTGEAVVFRAKSVILATGSYIWAAGYNGQGAYSIGSPENTGDGFKMLIDAGVEFADMEHMVTDVAQWYPKGCRQGMGGICGSTPTHVHILDKDMKRVTEKFDEGGGYSEFFRLLAKAELDGRCIEVEEADVGGFYMDIEGIGLPAWNRYYARVPENYKRALDYTLPQHVKDVYSQWDCCGKPSHLNKYGETTIPGVFFASASESGAFMYACGSGWIAGEGAAERAQGMEAIPAIQWDQVETLLTEAYGLLEAEPKSRIRSLEVFRNVQKAYWSGLKPLRDASMLQACIDEVDRIETDDYPNMYIPSKSKRYNTDWLRALEVKSLLRVTKASALAALAREESRGYHCRVDFPKIDNDSWLKNVHVALVNGEWSVEARDIDDSIISADVLKVALPSYGLE